MTIQAFKGHAGMTPVPKASAVHRAAADNEQKAPWLEWLVVFTETQSELKLSPRVEMARTSCGR